MSQYAFAAALDIKSAPKITQPAPTKAKNVPEPIELQNIAGNHRTAGKRPLSQEITPVGLETPYEARTVPPTGSQTPKTPNELESSTPTDGNITSIVPGWSYPRMNKWRVLSACLTYFGNGMNDSG